MNASANPRLVDSEGEDSADAQPDYVPAPARIVRIGSSDAEIATANPSVHAAQLHATQAQIEEVYSDPDGRPGGGKPRRRTDIVVMAPNVAPPVVAPLMRYEVDTIPEAINAHWHTISIDFPDERAYQKFFSEFANVLVPECGKMGFKFHANPNTHRVTIKRKDSSPLDLRDARRFINRLQLINKPAYSGTITVDAQFA